MCPRVGSTTHSDTVVFESRYKIGFGGIFQRQRGSEASDSILFRVLYPVSFDKLQIVGKICLL